MRDEFAVLSGVVGARGALGSGGLKTSINALITFRNALSVGVAPTERALPAPRGMYGYLEKGIQTPMARGQSSAPATHRTGLQMNDYKSSFMTVLAAKKDNLEFH